MTRRLRTGVLHAQLAVDGMELVRLRSSNCATPQQSPLHQPYHRRRRCPVNPWIILGIVLFVAWAVLWLMFRIATGLIHLLVIIAIAMFIWGLVKRGARAVNRRV